MEISLSYRYPGVKPFNTAEEEIFYGREKDIKDFFDFIATRQISVLYGKSGLGKSSLINAGIIPLLNSDPSYKNNFQFFFRFNKLIKSFTVFGLVKKLIGTLCRKISADFVVFCHFFN